LTVRRLSSISGPRSPRSGEKGIENPPLRVRQIAATQCCLLQKGSLESKLDSSVKNRQHGLVALFFYLPLLNFLNDRSSPVVGDPRL